MSMTEERVASLTSIRKYRRLDASPARGSSFLTVARNGSRVRTVSATSARSGRARGRLVVAGSIVAISAALYWHDKNLSRDGVLCSALKEASSADRADHRTGGICNPIRPGGRAKGHEGLMHLVRRAVQGRSCNSEHDGILRSVGSDSPTERPIAEH